MSESSAGRALLRWVVPSLGSVLGLAALANALFVRSGRLFATDGDAGRHIRVGRTILDLEFIPRTDLLSHTRGGEPFVPYEWLSEVVTAIVHQAAGLAGVAAMSALLYVVAVVGVYRTTDELGAPRLLGSLVALLALLLQSVHLLPRPHLFTTAFAAVYMVVLVRFARTDRPWSLVPLPILMLVWANSHGGFLVGFILLVAFLCGSLLGSPEFSGGVRAARPLVVTLVSCVAASLLNPVGPELWRHTTGYLGIDFLVAATQEYRSVDFHEAYGKIFFVALFAGPALWMTGRIRVTWLAAGLYLFFAAAALHSARNIPLFTVAALPWLAVWTDEALRRGSPASRRFRDRLREFERTDRQLRPGASMLVGLALVLLTLGPRAERYRFDRHAFPVDAVAAFDRLDTSGRVFNQMRYGGYLLYARPDIPVFIDGQTDFYGERLSRDYLAALSGAPRWREVLEEHGIAWTLTDRSVPLNQLLALDPGWQLIYEDDVSTIYRRVGHD